MKKLVFALGKADNKTRVLGIVALALAVIAILLVAIPASKAINGPIKEIAIIKMIPSAENAFESIEESQEKIADELEKAIDNDDEGYLEDIEEKTGIDAEEVLEIVEEPITLKSLSKLSAVFNDGEKEGDNVVTKIFTTIIGVIKWYAIALCAFVFFSMIGMNKGFFITAVCISPVFFFLFAGIVLFPVFLGLCIAYSILVGKVKKAYIIYKHEQTKAAEAPVVEEV